ncbi:phosphatase PAP2 family protein [Chitinophaga sp. 30R24]|uniref:phosphatase PAP2 family protein n=1 Tax=Chitinophaga sp. 30R24 TaxID=3248838 RepID=UPI003B8F428A
MGYHKTLSGRQALLHMAIPLFLLTTFSSRLQAQTRLQQFDDNILEHLAAGRTNGQTVLWRTISDANNYVNVGAPAALLITGLIKNDANMKYNSLYMATSAVGTELINLLVKKLVKRPRPFITNVHLVPVYKPGSYSFPSGHTSSAFSTATSLSRAYPKWYIIAPSFLWAASVGYSRMYLGVHYPTDVAAGAILGTGTALATGFLRH